MGWTWYHAEFYKNGKPDRKAEMDEKFSWEDETKTISVLKSTMRGSVYYAAIQRQDKTNGEKTVTAAVCLTGVDTREWFNFGYKDMDETMGPYESKCPKGILDLLTPIDSEWANQWRARCRENLNKKKRPVPPVGTVIEFTLRGQTKRAVRHAPAYQFRRPFWYVMSDGKYISAKYLPEDYTIITE